MSKYSAARTAWKAFWTWLQTIGVVGAAGVLAVEWPEDPAALTADGWIVFAMTLLPAIWRALENWRKNSGPNGTVRFEWTDIWAWLQDVLGISLVVLLLAGCATARTEARISQTDADGFTESVEFTTRGVVTWGSGQDLQRGDLDYTWADGAFRAGGSATNQRAADPVTDVLVRLIEKLMPQPAAMPEPTEEAEL